MAFQDIEADALMTTVIFIELDDFKRIVAMMSPKPQDLVRFMDKFFTHLDRKCDHYTISKIETVGETYLAAAGLGNVIAANSKSDEDTKKAAVDAHLTIQFGLSAIYIASNIKFSTGRKLTIKVGIHSGRAIRGIVGSHKPQYVLIGDTVNTSARMKGKGASSCVHISDSTRTILREIQSADQLYEWEERTVQVKGKGDMQCFLLRYDDVKPTEKERRKVIESYMAYGFGNANAFPSDGPSVSYSGRYQHSDSFRSEMDDADTSGASSPTSNQSSHKAGQKRGSGASFDQSKTSDGPQGADHLQNHRIAAKAARLAANFGQQDSGQDSMSAVGDGDFSMRRQTSYDEDITGQQFTWALRFEPEEELAFRTDTRQTQVRTSRGLYATIFVFMWVIGKMCCIQSSEMPSTRLYAGSSILAIWSFLIACFLGFVPVTHYIPIVLLLQPLYTFGLLWTCVPLHWIGGATALWEGPSRAGEALVWSLLHTFFGGLVFWELLPVWIVYTLGSVWALQFESSASAVLYLAGSVISLAIVMNHEVSDRAAFRSSQAMHRFRQRSDGLLSEMLPSYFAKQQNSGLGTVAIRFEKMVILYADIVGFTKYSKSVEAEQVVKMLSHLFGHFDAMLTRHSVYKLYTIGDAYVALTEPEEKFQPRFAQGMISFAEEMVEIIQGMADQPSGQYKELNMRIGLHLGDVVGGVIGTKKLRFDVWGVDTLIANEVESNGAPGRVSFSQPLVDMLEQHFPQKYTFSVHKAMRVLDKEVQLHLLESSDGGDDNIFRPAEEQR